MPQSDETPLLRFGVIADPQYADLDPNAALNRHYRQSLGKLEEAIAAFNAADLDFVVTLGDIIDRNWESFDAILPLYEALRHKRFFLLGNHDFAVAPERLANVFDRVGMPASHYDFAVAGTRFIAIDGNEISLFAAPEGDPRREQAVTILKRLEAEGAGNAHRWNAALSDRQFDWLSQTLDAARAAGERVIVMGHYPIYPPNQHNMWDCERLTALLAGDGNIIAYLSGHDHDGNFGEIDGRYFINFKGMVDTPDQNTFAIVSLYADRLEVEGFGREDSRVLPLAKRA